MNVGDLITNNDHSSAKDIYVISSVIGDGTLRVWTRYTFDVGMHKSLDHNKFHFKNSEMNTANIEDDDDLVVIATHRLVTEQDFPPEIITKAREIL